MASYANPAASIGRLEEGGSTLKSQADEGNMRGDGCAIHYTMVSAQAHRGKIPIGRWRYHRTMDF
ncbi:hypothetical protein IE4872_CH02435 [Rhizobium gallicum]|uniref:Uncharacterized protein n=1 Tax=Rhizobium gallicum TaxID=56730 RepID=A0A1L5NJL0_9HYPH|nr:hypothetical protein IE4872_CH02435 [Rhizobium gallicum]